MWFYSFIFFLQYTHEKKFYDSASLKRGEDSREANACHGGSLRADDDNECNYKQPYAIKNQQPVTITFVWRNHDNESEVKVPKTGFKNGVIGIVMAAKKRAVRHFYEKPLNLTTDTKDGLIFFHWKIHVHVNAK